MIIGNVQLKTSEFQKTLELLKAAAPEFYLTGSRFFGGFNAGSDFDFFVQDSEIVRRFLLINGFISRPGNYYNDRQCNAVMRKCHTGEVTVDVQLVRNVVKKRDAQEKLRELGTMSSIPKEARAYLWKLLLGK